MASHNSINLSWDTVYGAKRYVVYKDSEVHAQFVTKTPYVVEGLAQATEYCFTVTAVNYPDGVNGKESAHSNKACATTDITIPSAPQNVVLVATSPYSVKLTWNPVAGAASYNIYLINGTPVVDSIQETEYIFEGLTPEGKYCYAVSAVNAKGESDQSGSNRVNTPLPTPEAPQLTAKVVGSAVELTWNAPAHATTYKVYEDEDLVAEGLSSTTYTVYDLEAGEHCFTVVAVGAGGESAPSAPACATVTEQEQGPIVENVIIGSGKGSTTVLPSTFSSVYSISQQIYTRAEIGQIGEIKSVSFKYKSGSATTRTVKVYMKHSVQGVFTDSNS
jgi:fibronectin type 3 domain-containing protein